MPTATGTDWQRDFGLQGRKPPAFFAGADDIDAAGSAAPQAHVLRRAFEDLRLSGVLCQDNSPIIYFREVDKIDASGVAVLHRTFWNQGVAPILVLIDPDEVHIYSGLSEPTVTQDSALPPQGLIEKLSRVAEKLQAFILAVESGEYFRQHRPSFDPRQRVDRSLLQQLKAARDLLDEVPAPRLQPLTLDGLLCRLVFSCYLFDRKVIDRKYLEEAGIFDAEHLRDILGRHRRSEAKAELYALFEQLGRDFNGDLFSGDLADEAKQVQAKHLDILHDFIRGTDPRSHQPSFWPYEFGIIPIETISAIYEHFLKAADPEKKKAAGAFFTPRVLAELVLDQALTGELSLLDKRFLDPSCGSGIFLVGLFNRLAEEWGRKNPNASYDARLKGLTAILQRNLFGIDSNRTACLITTFSLYLAFLDQLSPPDIRRVLKKVKVLPPLVADDTSEGATIRHADFFTDNARLPHPVDYVVGNPPWAKAKDATAPVLTWCAARRFPFPGKQIATAFVWKAPDHLTPEGKVCFVLPNGLLFNHTESAIEFQKRWFRTHAVEVILNLADFQRFLFEEAEFPALVVRYAKEKPANSGHRIDYWSPKTDWAVTQAEVISILPQDRARLTVREVLDDLASADAPMVWKERYWATLRDCRLMDRLRLYPRLRDAVGQRGGGEHKRWIIAEGFEPFGRKDSARSRRHLRLTATAKVEASTHRLALFLLQEECDVQATLELDLRRAISNQDIFKKPLVLIKEGFSTTPAVAFAAVNVAYRHGIRGIHGPTKDRDLLAFLTFYLRSMLSCYFLFHTSGSWGVSRDRVDIEDLLRLPFPFPDQTDNPRRSIEIVSEAGQIMTEAMREAAGGFLGRDTVIERAQARAEPLVEEYFEINDIERMLIADTTAVIIPSARPGRTREAVPTVLPAQDADRGEYVRLLCDTLNQWANKEYQVHGKTVADSFTGIGMVVLEKTRRGENPSHLNGATRDVLGILHRLQRGAARGRGTVELVRGLKVFEKSQLFITKPIGRRFWTRTAALNDADEIAGTLLMQPAKENA